jgi:protein-S-isoprenylcysteine O-methyltransferase Ste14
MSNNLFYISLSVLGFAVVHSLTASISFKVWLRNKLGEAFFEGWFRLFYNILSTVTLAPILLLAVGEGTLLWTIKGNIVYLFQFFRLVALFGILISFHQIDWKSFIGIRQALAYYRKVPAPTAPERLVISGIYRFTRHPLYLFSILFLWCKPTMPLPWFVFSSVATLYFLVGSLLEEKKMVQLYGNQYREYQKTVSWLIPFSNKI